MNQPDDAAPDIVDASVFSPLPIGARDLLPPEVRTRRALTHALLERFGLWGYREVAPPLIEYFEVLGRGLGPRDRERCVRFIEAGAAASGALLALRSDITPQIARMVAQRVGGTVAADDSLRLCYAATSVRLPEGRHDRAELHQVGVELVGDARPSGDAELIALADEALTAVGLRAHRFDLSHLRVVNDALQHLGISESRRRALLDSLARKDRSGVEQQLERAGVRGRAAQTFAMLAELHGPPELLEANQARIAEIGAGPAVERLRAVVATVEREYPQARGRLLVDLGEARGFDYYTGMRMRVWAPGVGAPVVRGGRYDDLVARYGAQLPATGLAFDLDALEQALVAAGSEVLETELSPARLVVLSAALTGDAQVRGRAAAVVEAREARASGLRAWIETKSDLDTARHQARRRGARELTWIAPGEGEALTQERWRWAGPAWERVG